MGVVSGIKPALKAPLTVSMWVTDRCNLDCKYCYAEPESGKMMDPGRMAELINEFAALQVFDMTIAGGEPFMHPAIYDIISQVLDSGIQVGVLSNGVLLGRRAREKLVKVVAGRPFILQISLDAVDPEVNDLTRGHGALVLDHIRELAKLGIELQISCVINKSNIDSAHLLIDELYPEVKRFHFLNIQRTERSLQHPELLVSDEEAYEFWMRLANHAKSFPPDLFLPSLRIMLRSYGVEDEQDLPGFNRMATFDCKSCSVGLTKVEIDTEFNVLGCDIAKDFTHMGNVREQSFVSVWNSEQAHKVRQAPFPPCYMIKSPDGASLKDNLRKEFVIKPMLQAC